LKESFSLMLPTSLADTVREEALTFLIDSVRVTGSATWYAGLLDERVSVRDFEDLAWALPVSGAFNAARTPMAIAIMR
jgi:hypothetical protein